MKKMDPIKNMNLATLTRRFALVWLLGLMGPLLMATEMHAAGAVGDFTVESPVDGKRFTLSQARGSYVVLHFLLKTECPFCLKHTRDYAKQMAGISGVVQVFLKPDSAEEIRAWSGKVAGGAGEGDSLTGVTIYRDADAVLAQSYGIPGGYAFHGEQVHYPALLILDPAGKEVYRYVGKSNADRLPFPKFAEQLAMLKEKAALSRVRHFNLPSDRLALQGYDPVGYFLEGEARKGKPEWSVQYQGVTYRFSSENHRARFQESPDRYLPAYGGWCATAMAKGEKVEIDPTNFKVTGGRLFLFFKAFYANAIKDWNKDEPGLTAKADSHWEKLQQ